MKKRGLGKGLEALLGEEVTQAHAVGIGQSIAIDELQPNPFQPRTEFDEKAIDALADSIRQYGIIQPLAVRRVKKNGASFYEIIAGERRHRAAKQVGLTEVPITIHDIDDHDSAAFALIENLQREDLNVIEKAKGIKTLIEKFDLTHEACGKILGQSRSAISNALRLLDLGAVVQKAIAEKSIEMGHARALLGVEKATQQECLNQVLLQGLSVRETEALIRNQKTETTPAKNRVQSSQMAQTEASLSARFETKVKIYQRANRSGKITLVFDDETSLEKLIGHLQRN